MSVGAYSSVIHSTLNSAAAIGTVRRGSTRSHGQQAATRTSIATTTRYSRHQRTSSVTRITGAVGQEVPRARGAENWSGLIRGETWLA